jgi:G3E family GTPase
MNAYSLLGMPPVHVLTGPLGSGKSTLLNRLLHTGLAPDTAIIVNEFGEAGLDRTFIQESSDEVLLMDNGCICCSLRSDLSDTLMRLAALRDERGWPMRRVIIETSGISDPVPILHTLRSDNRLRDRFRAGSVLCTVDAQAGAAALRERPEYVAQLGAADLALLTKSDLVNEQALGSLCAAVASANPLATVVRTRGALYDYLVHADQRTNHIYRQLESLVPPPAHATHAVQHVVLRYPGPLSWPLFAIWLTRMLFLHGDRILRTKGILFDRDRDAWIGVHAVRRFLHPPVHLELERAPESGSCLVFITDGIDPARIARSYGELWQASSGCPADPLS